MNCISINFNIIQNTGFFLFLSLLISSSAPFLILLPSFLAVFISILYRIEAASRHFGFQIFISYFATFAVPIGQFGYLFLFHSHFILLHYSSRIILICKIDHMPGYQRVDTFQNFHHISNCFIRLSTTIFYNCAINLNTTSFQYGLLSYILSILLLVFVGLFALCHFILLCKIKIL